MALCGRHGNTKELRWIGFKGLRHSQQGVQGGVSHPAFDVADHLLGQSCALGDLGHGEALAFALLSEQAGDVCTDGL